MFRTRFWPITARPINPMSQLSFSMITMTPMTFPDSFRKTPFILIHQRAVRVCQRGRLSGKTTCSADEFSVSHRVKFFLLRNDYDTRILLPHNGNVKLRDSPRLHSPFFRMPP